MAIYLLKVSFVIGIALLFYKCVLQQESFFATNRLYLVASIMLAFALPFVSLPQFVSHQGYMAAVLQPASPAEATAAEPAPATATSKAAAAAAGEQLQVPVLPPLGPEAVEAPASDGQTYTSLTDWVFWLVALYVFGVAVFALNLFVQAGSILYKAVRSTDKVEDGGCVIVNTGTRQAPCSFFRYIFIYPDDYDFETYEQIIAHEKVHVRQGHTLDLLLAELAVILLWFNPLMWLYKKEIEKNIEYQTDAMLLEKEQVAKDQYQLNLLQIACPNKPLSITTNYNQSLLKQRIKMMNAKKSSLNGYWKYAFLAPLLFGTLLFMNEPAASKTLSSNTTNGVTQWDEPKAGKKQVKQEADLNNLVREQVQAVVRQATNINISGQETDMTQGYWYSHQESGQYCLELKGSKNSSNWNMSRCFDKGLIQKRGNDVFVITKETGTMELTGALDAEVSQGKYTFTEDASFKQFLADNGIVSEEKNFMFHLFLGDINRKYVSFLKQTYPDIAGERLLELAVHGISMDNYQRYMALFQKYSNKKPTVEEVVAARIHGIDEAYVQEIQAMGFKDLSMKKMMEAKIHGVSQAYAEGLRSAGFGNLSIDKIIEAKIHGVNPASIGEIQTLGFGELDLDDIIGLKIHGVNALYIQDLKLAGLDNLSMDDVLAAKIHGLSSGSVKEITAMGFSDLAFDDLMDAQIHGVDAAYIEDLRRAGLQNLTMRKTVEAKIHGIDSDFIQQAKQKGYNLNSVDKYIELKIHGMAMESLKGKN